MLAERILCPKKRCTSVWLMTATLRAPRTSSDEHAARVQLQAERLARSPRSPAERCRAASRRASCRESRVGADAAIRGQADSFPSRRRRREARALCRRSCWKKRCFSAAVVIDATRKRQTDDQDVVGIQAEIDALQRDEAAHQQTGADEQHERQRDLRDDERAAQPAAAEPATRRPCPNPLAARRCCASPSASPARARRATTVSTATERLNARTGRFSRMTTSRGMRPLGDERDDPLDTGVREQASDGHPARGEQQALDQQLSNQPRAVRAERGADGHLARRGSSIARAA